MIKPRKTPYKLSSLEEAFCTAFFGLSDELYFDLYLREYPLLQDKRRFDVVFPVAKVAIEIQGGIFNNGKYNKGVGIAAAHNKHNAATMRGWAVLTLNTLSIADEYYMVDVRRFIQDRTETEKSKIGSLEFYKMAELALPYLHNPAYNESYEKMLDDLSDQKLSYRIGEREVVSLFPGIMPKNPTPLSIRQLQEQVDKFKDNKGNKLHVYVSNDRNQTSSVS